MVRPSASMKRSARRAQRQAEALRRARFSRSSARLERGGVRRQQPGAEGERPAGAWRLRRRRSGSPSKRGSPSRPLQLTRAAARSRSACSARSSAPRRLAISAVERALAARSSGVRSRRCRSAVVVAKMTSPRRSDETDALCGSRRAGAVRRRAQAPDGARAGASAERRRQRAQGGAPRAQRVRESRRRDPPLPQRAVPPSDFVAPLTSPFAAHASVLARGTAIDSRYACTATADRRSAALARAVRISATLDRARLRPKGG